MNERESHGTFWFKRCAYGEAQANALAWGYAVECDALNAFSPSVKIVPFKVKFDLVVEAIPEDAQAKGA